jgi:hypothetical protein
VALARQKAHRTLPLPQLARILFFMKELLDLLEERVTSLMEETLALRQENMQLRQELADKTAYLMEENAMLREELSQEHTVREMAANRIDVLLQRLTKQIPE